MSSKPISPTPEQLAVIQCDVESFTVSASAGAGKTGVLVERYLRHVREGRAPDQILTITFTRKAAAEMKERIVERLIAEGLLAEAQIAETGPIQTIHGFCERMLRENAIEAGLDPEFEILSEAASSRLIDECVRHALAEPTGECGWAEALLIRLAGQSLFRGGGGSPHGQLESAVREAMSKLRGSGANFDMLAQTHADPTAVLFHWQRAVVESLPAPVKNSLREVPSGEGFHERLRQAYKLAELRPPRWLASKVDPRVDEEAAEHACGLMWIVLTAWAALDRAMRERQALDFSALEERAVRLVKESPRTAERLRKQYPVLLIDEAQDVNPVQYELLDALSPETRMMVGDGQQSIYGFRQADVQLFFERVRQGMHLRLTKNHRSGDGILRFVDDLFGSLWQEEYRPMLERAPMKFESPDEVSYEGVEVWMQRDRDPHALAAYVDEMARDGLELRSTAVLVRGLRYAIELQGALKARGIASRIAGGSERFYTRLEIRDLANALCALADPLDDYALLTTLRSPFCGLSIDSIARLARAGAIYESLATFQCAVPEDGEKLVRFLEWFGPMARYADRMPAWEVLSELFAKSGYLEALARRRNRDQLLANVRKLLSLASQERDLGPAEYAERIREIQNLRHREGDAPAENDKADMLTIMTIHKAKGLEFETVIVPETHYQLESKGDPLQIEPRLGIVVPKFGRAASPFHSWVAEGRRKRNTEEEHRVLYVAMTRARSRLCVVAHPRAKRNDCFAKLVATQLRLDRGAPQGLLIRDSQDVLQPDE